MNKKQILKEIENMGEEAIKYYNQIKNDPNITKFILWDFGFAFLSAEDTIRYIYIKPSERNKGRCSELVKLFKINGASPEIIHIMDKNNLLFDLKTKGFKGIAYSESEIICYDVEVGYQIKPLPMGLMGIEYNRWTGEYFEVIEEIIPACPFKKIRKRMMKHLEELKAVNPHHMKMGIR